MGSCTTSGIAVATYRRTVLRMRTWVPAAGSWFRIVPSASLLGCSTTLTTRFWRCRSGGAFADLQTCHGGNGNHVVSLGARNIHVYGAAALYRFAAGGFGIHNGACGNALVLHIFAYNLKAAIL